MTVVTVVDKVDGSVLAEGNVGVDVQEFEGNLYFDPAAIKGERLVLTDRIYICPYKGQALWYDIVTEHGSIRDVAWVYPDPKPGFTHIKGKIGFYSTSRSATAVRWSEEV